MLDKCDASQLDELARPRCGPRAHAPSDGGVTGRALPVMTSVGALMRATSSRRSDVAHRGAARDVACRRLTLHHRLHAGDRRRLARDEVRREPASEHRVGDRRMPPAFTFAIRWFHMSGSADLRRGVGEDQPVDARRRVHAEPHARDAAQRQAAERCALGADVIEERDDVAPEVLDRVRSRRHAASGRDRACRSARCRSAAAAPRSAAPTSQGRCRASWTARARASRACRPCGSGAGCRGRRRSARRRPKDRRTRFRRRPAGARST